MLYKISFIAVLVMLFNHSSQAGVRFLDESCQNSPAATLIYPYFAYDDPKHALSLILDRYNALVLAMATPDKKLENRYSDKMADISNQLEKLSNFTDAKENLARAWMARNYSVLDRMNGKQSKASTCLINISIWGEISKNDVEDFKSIISGYANPPFMHVYLNSKGGSVDSAIEIGRLIRKHYGITFVDGYRQQGIISEGCYSACVLIYAGGIARSTGSNANTPVGVHAHYFSKTDLAKMSIEDSLDAVRTSTKRISEYFSDLGVNQDLLTFSQSIPSDKMHVLTHSELKRFLPYAVHEYRTVLIPKRQEAEDCLALVMEPWGACYYKMMIESFDRLGPNRELLDYVLELEKIMLENSDQLRWVTFFRSSGYYLRTGAEIQGLSY